MVVKLVPSPKKQNKEKARKIGSSTEKKRKPDCQSDLTDSKRVFTARDSSRERERERERNRRNILRVISDPAGRSLR